MTIASAEHTDRAAEVCWAPGSSLPVSKVATSPGTKEDAMDTKTTAIAISPKRSEASVLENETKRLLGRKAGLVLRAAHYSPTLEEFSSTPFADFVRRTILGVPLEGGFRAESNEVDTTHPTPVSPESSPVSTGLASIVPIAQNSSSGEVVPSPTVANDERGAPRTRTPSLRIAARRRAFLSLTKAGLSELTNIDVQRHIFAQQKTSCEGNKNKSPEESQSGRADVGPCLGSSKAQKQPGMVTRSRSRRLQGNVGLSRSHGERTNSAVRQHARSSVRGKRLAPCPLKMSDGIAKVTPPEGWWDRSGIANDMTARGPKWQTGTKLGDMLVTTPIKQCASGIGGIYEFTMLEMPPVSVADFRIKADEYRKRHVGSSLDEDTSFGFMDGLARKFWRRLGPTMEAALYGADLEGTLFDGAYACGWNVDRLESCLSLLRADADNGDRDDVIFKLPGVTSAYLYFGMWASVFAVHNEDMNLLSINYLHAGAPKYWYSISPEDSNRFESLAALYFAAASSNCSEFLRHKRYLLSPTILNKAGIRYKTQVQRAGDVVITFPGCYHFGFNTGFNIAESTNFAVPEWVPMGNAAQVCMCHPHSVRIDMSRFGQLLHQYEMYADSVSSTAKVLSYIEWAKREARIRKRELANREDVNSCSYEEDSACPHTTNLSKGKGFLVEVMRSTPRASSSPDTTKKSQVSKRKQREIEDWRLALRVKPETFTTQTPILCFVQCDELEERVPREKCFSGTVTSVVEGYARIHFAGTNRKEDIWMLVNSAKLFLDGGPEDPPDSSIRDTKKRCNGVKDSRIQDAKKKRRR